MTIIARMMILCIAMFSAFTSVPVWAHGDEQHGTAAAAQKPVAQAVGDEPAAKKADAAGGEIELADEVGSSLETLRMLHPATVHFPIALLLLAAAVEALLILRPNSGLEQTVRIILYFAAAGTVTAALFGWIHTGMWMGGEALMQQHRWVGTGLAVLSIGLALLAARPPDHARRTLRTGLSIAAIAVVLQGYWGAELSHGPEHLSQQH